MVIRHPRRLSNSLRSLAIAVTLFTHASSGAAPPTPPPSSPKPAIVHVIELHGTVGKVPGASGGRAITADEIRESIAKARKAGATVVVLDIDGPGGLVTEMRQMVEVILEAQKQDGMRVVALPREAYSAWSIVGLSCKEIIVTPMTRMGAAVTVTPDGRGGFIEVPDDPGAVAQKMKAPWNALRKMVETYTGRPPCIMDAMQEQKAELWWSPTSGFAATKGSGSDWEELDDGVKVCCLNRDDLIRTKLAMSEVKPTELENTLPSALGLSSPCRVMLIKPAATAAVPANGAAADDTARRVASRKCREVWDRLGRISFDRQVVTETTWEDIDDDRYKDKIVKERRETDKELGARVAKAIKGISGKIPSSKSVPNDTNYAEYLEEIRSLLKEAVKSGEEAAPSAARDRLEQARGLLKQLANRY